MEAFTATAIANLVTQKFFESSAGELAKNFTPVAYGQINKLWQIIKQRFQGNSRREEVLTSIESGSSQDLNRFVVYLEDAMEENKEFAAQLQAIAEEIKAGQLQENTTMTMKNRDHSTGYQVKTETVENIGGTHHHHYPQPPDT